jgi:hypothetical protein
MGPCEHCRHGKRRLRNARCRPPPRRDLRCAKSAPKRTGRFSSSPAVASPHPPTRSPTEPPGPQPGGSPFLHSSRSNSREFALTLTVWMSQWPMRRTRGCNPFLYSLRWACRNKAYTSGARSSLSRVPSAMSLRFPQVRECRQADMNGLLAVKGPNQAARVTNLSRAFSRQSGPRWY